MRIKIVLCLLICCLTLLAQTASAQASPTSWVNKLGVEIDVRSNGRILADDLAASRVIFPDAAGFLVELPAVRQFRFPGGNVQVNSPTEDYVQIFRGFRPFVHATQSETSAAVFGSNVVVTYNDSTGIHVSPFVEGGLVLDRVQISGFATSNDDGRTWKSGFIPPSAGATDTFGDPSVGVDRHGVFYFANLAADAVHGTIQVNKSTDGGNTWSAGVVVQEDDASDKEWLAVGPDPVNKRRDNVYVTWTSFQQTACELRFGRSTDGGATFTAKTILVPTSDPDPTHPQNCLTFTNPVVDQVTGTLYVPFLHFSNGDQDFIQMLISNDAGETFHFAKFNIPGAPDTTVMPVTQPGELTSCGTDNIRLTVHDALFGGFGQFGFPRYINASRMTLQPALGVRNGVVYLAWNNSTSLAFGDPHGNSNVLFMRSDDGGNTWAAPIVVNPPGTTDTHHVLPSLAIDDAYPNDVYISYYTQHSDGTIDLDMANSHDRGASFPADQTVRVTSTPFNLPPSNIPLSGAPSFAATNYDRLIAECYALGEYQSITTGNASVYAAWGDMRNTLTEPINALDPISGKTHSEEDVFFQKLQPQVTRTR